MTPCTRYDRRAIPGPYAKRRGAASRLPRAFSSGGAQSGRQGRGVPGRWGTGLELAQTLLDRRAARTRLGGGRLEVQAVAIQRVRIRLEAIEVVLKVGDARVVLREIAFQSCIFSGGRPPVRRVDHNGGHHVRGVSRIGALGAEGRRAEEGDAGREGQGTQVTRRHETTPAKTTAGPAGQKGPVAVGRCTSGGRPAPGLRHVVRSSMNRT